MSLPLQKKRELLFLTLFAISYPEKNEESSDENLIALLMETLKTTKKNCIEALIEAKKILPHIPTFDKKIENQSKSFTLDRIPHVEKTILRLALAEHLTLPTPICIAEAIRLSKKFATPEALTFINALLDVIFLDSSTSHSDGRHDSSRKG